jgi:hypothetical protein
MASISDGLSEEVYEEQGIKILFYKLFPLLIKDFLTRSDAKEMMKSSNLVTTVNPGIPVATTGTPAAQTGATTAPGKARVSAIYKGEFPLAGTKKDEQVYEARRRTGNAVISEASLGNIPTE